MSSSYGESRLHLTYCFTFVQYSQIRSSISVYVYWEFSQFLSSDIGGQKFALPKVKCQHFWGTNSAATIEMGGSFIELKLGMIIFNDKVSDKNHSASDNSDLDSMLL